MVLRRRSLCPTGRPLLMLEKVKDLKLLGLVRKKLRLAAGFFFTVKGTDY
jgi:hypothetical protein